jgi:hypothetical protein
VKHAARPPQVSRKPLGVKRGGVHMTQAEISAISPFFIVSHVPSSLSFYRDRLGFEITFQGPAPDDIFFGIVRRGGAQILLKEVGVAPLPNYKRDNQKRVSPAGTHSLSSRILTHWRPNLLRAMSSFPSH